MIQTQRQYTQEMRGVDKFCAQIVKSAIHDLTSKVLKRRNSAKHFLFTKQLDRFIDQMQLPLDPSAVRRYVRA